jgi:hypothetical protein
MAAEVSAMGSKREFQIVTEGVAAGQTTARIFVTNG